MTGDMHIDSMHVPAAVRCGPNKALIGGVAGGCAALAVAAVALLVLWRRRAARTKTIKASSVDAEELSAGCSVREAAGAQ